MGSFVDEITGIAYVFVPFFSEMQMCGKLNQTCCSWLQISFGNFPVDLSVPPLDSINSTVSHMTRRLYGFIRW